MTIYGIATKCGIKMHPYPAFQWQSNNAFVFHNNFHTLTKRRKKKNEEID